MKLPRRQFLHLAAGVAALPFAPHVARAQAYPARPVRIIVGFPPGGSMYPRLETTSRCAPSAARNVGSFDKCTYTLGAKSC